MSFDQYFESTKKQQQSGSGADSSDDWYGIVEEALYAADLASYHRQRQQVELNLMKPLPIIPEDENAVEEPRISNIMYNPSCRPSSVNVYSNNKAETYPKNGRREAQHSPKKKINPRLEIPTEDAGSGRPSSVFHVDFDSPLSSESSALDDWASKICSTNESSMGSLRKKPFTRKSSSTGSAMSCRSASVGSSVMVGNGRSSGSRRSSSIYSTDTSVDAKRSVGVQHSRDVSTVSSSSSKEDGEGKCEEKPVGSFFDFSDDEEETRRSVSVVTRGDSSASSYVRQLREKALSFRLAASSRRAPRQQSKTLSTPTTADVSALSAWLLRASLVGRASMSVTSEEIVSEGQLMADAAESAKARRVLGMR